MSRLLKLKDWLTIDEAARHLSMMFEEEVTEADILRLALDGHLTLSINLVNHARGRKGKISIYMDAELSAAIASGNYPKDLEWTTFPPEITANLPGLPVAARGKPLTLLASEKLDSKRYITFEDSITSIEGVWDLPLIGSERLDVEHRFQALTGGPSITLTNLGGTLVQRVEGEMWQLMESFDDNEYQPGSIKQKAILEERILQEELNLEEASLLRNTFQAERTEYLEKRKSRPAHSDYYPAGGLPDDAFFVVRTAALLELQQRTSDRPMDENPVGSKERKTLLLIIAALCSDAGYDYKRAAKTAALIQRSADQLGVAIGETTIEGHLKKIPDALESRMK